VQWVGEAPVGDTEKIAGRREQREEMKLRQGKAEKLDKRRIMNGR
jgi:hypothetical protein